MMTYNFRQIDPIPLKSRRTCRFEVFVILWNEYQSRYISINNSLYLSRGIVFLKRLIPNFLDQMTSVGCLLAKIPLAHIIAISWSISRLLVVHTSFLSFERASIIVHFIM
uniref:Uncharacterized protein n=1 Tax=Lepeophtheirus salmonis TaxID=72036 RepID=A0A0K2VGE9_LEPSM